MRQYTCDFCDLPMDENMMYPTNHHHNHYKGIRIGDIGTMEFSLMDFKNEKQYPDKDICFSCVVLAIKEAMGELIK